MENVTTTGVFFEVEELTDGKNEYDTPKLVTQVAVVPKADKTEETKDEQKNTKHSLDLSEDKLKEDLVKILDVSIETIEID